MNLQSKKARVPIAALGVTALIAAAGAMASPAFAAPVPLTLSSGATTPAVGNFPYTTSAAAANAAYALKLTGADQAVTLSLVSAPTSGSLAYQKVATNGAAVTTGYTTLSTGGVVTNEVQSLNISGVPTGGTYTLTFDGQTTTAIPFGASAGTIQAALIALNNLATGDVVVSGAAPSVITFGGVYASLDVPQIIGDGQSLTGGTSPAATVTTTTPGSGAATAALGTPVGSDYIYVTGTVPGTYTFRMYQDTNASATYEPLDERSSDLVTLTVYDAFGTPTTSTADDVAPVIAADSPIIVGVPIVAGITYSKAISTADSRGDGGFGLSSYLAKNVRIDTEDGTTGIGDTLNVLPAYSASTLKTTYAVGTPGAAGTVALRADFTNSATPDPVRFGAKSVVVNSNTVTDLALAATDVVGSVKSTSPAVALKPGTAAVTYTATAINDHANADPADDTPVAGAVINFTIGGDNLADLTTDGTAVTGQPTVFSAITNASGVASLKVTSASTLDTDSYTVHAASNAVNSGPTLLTATYHALAAALVEVTSTNTELTPLASAGASVPLKGKITDNFGAVFVPTGSASTQAQVYLGAAGPTCSVSPVSVGTTTSSATAVASISGGAFSSTYSPVVTPTAGYCQAFALAYDISGEGTLQTGEWVLGTINYASAQAAGTVTLTSPNVVVAGANLSSSTVIAPQQSAGSTGTTTSADDFGDPTGQVTGTVLGADNAPLAFKAVTITGGAGVYFSTAITPGATAGDDLKTSITVVTNASGAFGGAYAFFTKAGTAAVTATAGAVSDAAAVTTDASNNPYVVSVNDAVGAPGSTLIITGTVMDAFGNPVPNTSVDLSIGTSTLGVIGGLIAGSVSTNTAGVFSTTFLSGTNQSGTADLTATLNGQIINRAADTHWLTDAGLVIADGDYQDVSTITISSTKLTLVATPKFTAGASGGTAKLTGTFMPGSTVEIWSKPSGSTIYSIIDTVTTNSTGTWVASETIKRSTFFLARANGLSSLSDQTQVWSKVSITAAALGKGKVRLYANGDPNAKATLIFYRSVKGPDTRLKTVTSSSFGSATVTVKLPKGTRKVYAVYTAPGTGKGWSKLISVKVK
jgi:hypothetical protein